MQRPKDLSREQLERIVDQVQQALYLDYDVEADVFYWDPEKHWSGSDMCDSLSSVLADLAMIPQQRMPFE